MIFRLLLFLAYLVACRRVELYNLCINDVKEEGYCFDSEQKMTSPEYVLSYPVKNLIMLRSVKNTFPLHVKHKKPFLFYNHGKCSCNPIF